MSSDWLKTGFKTGVFPNVKTGFKTDSFAHRDNTIKYHDYNKKRYDKNKNYIDFRVGDSIYVDNGHKPNRNKLDKLRIGPFKITNQMSNNVFEVSVGHGPLNNRLYHASKLLLENCTR